RAHLERPGMEGAPEGGERGGDRARRVRRTVFLRRRRALLGQRPATADRALAREGSVLMRAVELLRVSARANRLANLRLHAAMAPLTDAEFDAPRTSLFPRLAAHLNHVL